MEERKSILLELAKTSPGTIIQINIGDLSEFAGEIVTGVIGALNASHAKRKFEELLTISEVAAILKVSKMTLYRWDKIGVLRKIEVGGKRRYRRSDVEAIIENPKKTKR